MLLIVWVLLKSPIPQILVTIESLAAPRSPYGVSLEPLQGWRLPKPIWATFWATQQPKPSPNDQGAARMANTGLVLCALCRARAITSTGSGGRFPYSPLPPLQISVMGCWEAAQGGEAKECFSDGFKTTSKTQIPHVC